MDRAVLVGEINVAVAAEPGIPRPFVAGKRDEPPGMIEGAGQLVQGVVEAAGYLKVVALVPDQIEEGEVPREMEILQCRGGADRLLTLPVQIAPIGQQPRFIHDPHRVRHHQQAAFLAKNRDRQIARPLDDQAVDDQNRAAFFESDRLREPGDRSRGRQP